MQTLKQHGPWLVRLLLVIAASIAYITKSQADCGHSLWNLLAQRENVVAAEWTTPAFRLVASREAKRLGMVYDQSSKGNLALIQALCTIETPTVGVGEVETGAATAEAIASKGSIVPTFGPIHTFVEDWASYSVFFHVHLGPDTVVSTDTLWHFVTDTIETLEPGQLEVSLLTNLVTLETVATPAQAGCDLCDRGIETNSLREQWGVYMALGKALKEGGLDKATSRRLAQCRIEIGRRCRPYHITVHPSAGGQTGLSQARSSNFFKAIGKAFSSIGACRRAHS